MFKEMFKEDNRSIEDKIGISKEFLDKEIENAMRYLRKK